MQQALDAAKQKIDNVPYNKHTDDATRADYLNGQRGELTAAVDDVKFAQAQQRVIEKGAAAGSEFGGEDLGGLIKGKAIYSTLDIYLLQNNAKFDNFTGKYTVKILLPAGMRATEGLQVVYVNDDGSVEVFRTTFEDDGKYLVFETSHFSQFIILGESGRSGFWWWILLIIVAALALVGVSLLLIFLKKKDDDADKKKEGDPA